MAIIEKYIPPKERKKLGNLIFMVRYGKYILRSKPVDRSPGMIASSFQLTKLGKLIKQVLNSINTAYAGTVFGNGMNAFNCVISINKKHCFIGNTDTIDPSLLVLCENEGSFVGDVTLISTVLNTITGTFDSNAQNDEEGCDVVKAYGFDVKNNKIWQFDPEAIRSTGTITVTHPDMSGLNIAVYLECLDRVNLLNGRVKHVIKYVGTVKVV